MKKILNFIFKKDWFVIEILSIVIMNEMIGISLKNCFLNDCVVIEIISIVIMNEMIGINLKNYFECFERKNFKKNFKFLKFKNF